MLGSSTSRTLLPPLNVLCVAAAAACAGAAAEWAVLRYPENLTIANMLYYLAVPTLTYQVCCLCGTAVMVDMSKP
jgi:hypothetical protein